MWRIRNNVTLEIAVLVPDVARAENEIGQVCTLIPAIFSAALAMSVERSPIHGECVARLLVGASRYIQNALSEGGAGRQEHQGNDRSQYRIYQLSGHGGMMRRADDLCQVLGERRS